MFYVNACIKIQCLTSLKIKWSKFANIFLFNRLPAPGGGGTLYYGFSGSKVTNINY